MPKNAYKNNKHQDSKNRLNTVTSVGPEVPYQSQPAACDSCNTQEMFTPDQDIQKRAYEIYQQKGGSSVDNWLEAERIIREEQRSVSK